MLLAAALALGLRAAEPAAPLPSFEITHEGIATCAIVIAEPPSPAARLAATELQYHFWKISGAEVPILSERQPAPQRRILVGESAATRALGYRSDEFHPQEHLVAIRPDTVILIGRDWVDTLANRKAEGRPMTGDSLASLRQPIDFWKAVGCPQRSNGTLELPGLYDDQGTCLAAYDFLERGCGVRWYGPAPLNIVIPERRTLTVAPDEIRRTPGLKHRSALPSGSWPFTHGQWGQATTEQVQLYWRRSRQGGERWAANHTFYPTTIKAEFTDPDYQSKNPQTQGSQLCYSHPKLVRQVAQMADDYFAGKRDLPAGWKGAGGYVALVPDDNIHLCNCPECQRWLAKGKSQQSGFFSSGEMSDYWFTFVNAVARQVRQTHPNQYIATLAYWQYAWPPDFPIEPNVSVAPCLHTCYYAAHAGMRENDMRFYQQWRQKTQAPLFLWVYYHHPMEAGLIGHWKCFPNVMVHRTAEVMKQFIAENVRGIFECGEQDQLEQYIIAKVWDDPGLDVDQAIDEFFRLYFGPAGEPMKRFYLRVEQIACDPANYPAKVTRRDGIDWKTAAWQTLGTAERMEQLGTLMAQAERLATSGPEKERVILWRQALWDWMTQGRDEFLAASANAAPPKAP